MIKEALKNEISRLEHQARVFEMEIQKLNVKIEFYQEEARCLEAILELDEKPKKRNGK